MRATFLADVLRAAGCRVEERPGWKTRGRELTAVKGIILHHTGPTSSKAAAIDLIEKGRIGGANPLPGPLSQLVLDEDGTWIVIASGRTNHAGPGYWQGVSNGNSEMLGVEARNRGDGSPWPAIQMAEYIKGTDAILESQGIDPVMACGHKEWALPKGRKIDPTFDMPDFREALEAHHTGQEIALPRPERPARAMLQKGSRGDSVKMLQAALNMAGFPCGAPDGDFGRRTDEALKAFQRSKGLLADGKAGPKTWTALGVK